MSRRQATKVGRSGWRRLGHEPLRILTVATRWPTETSHEGIFVKQLVDAVRAQGHTVDVELIVQGRSRADYALAARRVRRRVARGQYDVLHSHYGLSALAGSAATKTPRVLTLYGSDVNVWWQRWITRVCSPWYDARIYVSRRLAERAGEPEATVIPNGVDFGTFEPGNRDEARATLGYEPWDRVVLFGASPERRVKGWDTFCQVVAELKGRGVSVRPLVLSESGQSRRRVVEKFNAADVLLFTSRRGSEGSPTVVKEAIAVGLPVVSVDVGDVREMLAGVEPSAVVVHPPGRAGLEDRALVAELADRTAEILSSGTRANGREQHRWLDVHEVAKRVVDVYRRVIPR